MRALHPCGTGCNGKRLTGSEYGNEKHTGEKICLCITERSAPYSVAVKWGWGSTSAVLAGEAELMNQTGYR